MEAKAITRYLRIAPRKVRVVINTVRHQPLGKAFAILANMNNKSARLVEKTLKSAQANAVQKKMTEAKLYVQEIRADGGPVFKRHMSRSMGRADTILKRTTHLSVILGERETTRKLQQFEEKELEARGLQLNKEEKGRKKAAAGAAHS